MQETNTDTMRLYSIAGQKRLGNKVCVCFFQFYTKLTYMIVVGLLGLATMVVVMWEKFNRPEYRTTRAAVFVSLVSSASASSSSASEQMTDTRPLYVYSGKSSLGPLTDLTNLTM